MKNFFKTAFEFVAAAALVLSVTQYASADNTSTPAPTPAPRQVMIGLNNVYLPGGFDSQSDAYVVVNGLFPNGCYRWKGADVKHVDTFNHEIRSYATVNPGMCLMVIIPFTQEIRLGKLASGSHNLKFLNGDGTYLSKTLNIE